MKKLNKTRADAQSEESKAVRMHNQKNPKLCGCTINL